MTFIEISPGRWLNLEHVSYISKREDFITIAFNLGINECKYELSQEEYAVLKPYLKGEKK